VTIGEVCLLTNDVPRLAAFYRQLLGLENDSGDETHQFLITEGTTLSVYNDGTEKNNQNRNICLAFTVEDIEKEYEKVLAMGARIIEAPAKRPWGAVNMSFYDPDNNVVYLRSFPDPRVRTALSRAARLPEPGTHGRVENEKGTGYRSGL